MVGRVCLRKCAMAMALSLASYKQQTTVEQWRKQAATASDAAGAVRSCGAVAVGLVG